MPPVADGSLDAHGATRAALLLVAGFVFIILGLANAHFFRRPATGQGVMLPLHEGAGILFAVVHLVLIWTAPAIGIRSAVAAVVLYATGLGLFLWTQETTKRYPPFQEYSAVDPESLIVWGPYRIVRHPFYLSYLLVWIAGAVATRSAWAALTVAIMAGSYVAAARQEEAAYSGTRFGAEYRGYLARTGMFVPKPRQLFAGSMSVSVAVVLAIVAALLLTAAIVFEVFTNPAMR
jgi:protein-S-isoprenylcysteine O-methyltransferase Ste14